jgi:histidinol-phosphate aminotransferase
VAVIEEPMPVPGPESGYRPGRSAEAVIAEYGLSRAVKLSSNEMPYSALPAVAAVLAAAHMSTQVYPDSDARQLREALAARHDTTAETVAVGNGSVSLIQQLLDALCGPERPVAYGWPSFEAYRLFTRRRQVPERTAPLRGTAVDLQAMAAAVTPHTRLVLVCSPNNPTGGAVDQDEFEDFLRRVPQALVVLDEAYAEFVTAPGAARGEQLFGRFDNVAVLRTFSKAYSLAGLRVGYLLAPPDIAAAVRRAAAPFSVNALAQAAALAAVQERSVVAERCRYIVGERDRVQRELAALGLHPEASQGNFVWLGTGTRTDAVCRALERCGVVARGYAPHGIRVTVSSREDNDFFLAGVAAVLQEQPTLFEALRRVPA